MIGRALHAFLGDENRSRNLENARLATVDIMSTAEPWRKSDCAPPPLKLFRAASPSPAAPKLSCLRWTRGHTFVMSRSRSRSPRRLKTDRIGGLCGRKTDPGSEVTDDSPADDGVALTEAALLPLRAHRPWNQRRPPRFDVAWHCGAARLHLA